MKCMERCVAERALIQQDIKKSKGVYDHVVSRTVNGIGMQGMVLQALAYYKTCYDDEPFTLCHCWMLIKECPKWKDLYASLKKGVIHQRNVPNDCDIIDLEDVAASSVKHVDRPRRHKTSKQEAKRDDSSLALQETLKGLLTKKEESSAKRNERKCQDKEEQLSNYLEMQKGKLDTDGSIARSKQKEIKLKSKGVKVVMLAEENQIMMA